MKDLEKLSDDELAEASRIEGGERAFGIIYNRYFDRIYGYLKNRVKSKEESKDLTNDTFYNAYRALKKGQYKQDCFSAWLITIAKNTSINHNRNKMSHIEKSNEWGYFKNLNIQSEEIKHINKDRNRLIMEELEKLSDVTKEALILYEFDELPYKEIADKLNIKIGTVKSRIHIARGKMKSKLMSKYPELFEGYGN